MQAAAQWYIYILECGDGTLYTGCTPDLAARVSTHQSGKGAKYTRSRMPVLLTYSEMLPDRTAALKREAQIKKLSRTEKLQLLRQG